MPAELARKSMKIFAEKVAPRLREDSLKLFQQQFSGINVEHAAETLH